MNWKNLKDCLCPKCGEALELDFDKGFYFCSNPQGCDFKVGKARFDEIQLSQETGDTSAFKRPKWSDGSGWSRFK